jgi:hypothetical protein
MSDTQGSQGATTTTTTNQTPASSQPAQATSDWTTGLSEPHRAYVQTKGFKDTTAVLESYMNMEKAFGAKSEHVIKLPENMDTPEGRAVFERLGAPKEAKDYAINIPKEHGDEKLASGLREIAHKFAFTNKQVEGLVGWWNEMQGGALKAKGEESATKLADSQNNLKKEWGAAYDQNLNIAKAGAHKYGLDKAKIDALESTLGFDGVMKLLHGFGRATGEAPFVQGQQAHAGVLAPSAAQAEIASLKKDPSFMKRYSAGEADALKKWENLHVQAAH